ncbi:hypothetical protein [Streptomyces montanisoli]|uniref:Uncharacterized protein n=1 Tax=Streptomyces montanisoli TaxID=2798581 RepID=A0A940RU20_9ACTN|nr:hypothetical protein [Streptomyces montanisoli]MBP0457492.1 hypothetical protein [Streptomyces montanisoli]
MKHVPFFRWVGTLGLLLIGCSVWLYATVPEPKQVDLTVISERPDGACTVRWFDPFAKDLDHVEREARYQCDVGRDPILKAPNYDPETGYGWDTGFVVPEGPHKGELEGDDNVEWRTTLSDDTLLGGVFLIILGAVGGNLRSLARMTGANPDIVRRARRLRDAAALVAQDHRLAMQAVREAWTPKRALEDPEVLSALRVLAETGPRGRKVAAAADALVDRLEPLLADAAPAAGRRQMLAAGREERHHAKFALAELRVVLDETETRGLAEQFAQTSVDLLRGADTDPNNLSTRVDFESRPVEYRSVLAAIVGRDLPGTETSVQQAVAAKGDACAMDTDEGEHLTDR